MNRKTFLSTLLAIVSAPFLVKSKEKTISIPPDDAAWLNANPALLQEYERAAWANLKEQQEKFLREEIDPRIKLASREFTVKGEDLIMVLNRKR